jgi:hypothetical protein
MFFPWARLTRTRRSACDQRNALPDVDTATASTEAANQSAGHRKRIMFAHRAKIPEATVHIFRVTPVA